ncbi:MAG: DUF4932 domain-containing protein [Planctomycetaceae bacterium]|nr:DUF4932 domain-containing protein [Planctomycetaceae bacterium]
MFRKQSCWNRIGFLFLLACVAIFSAPEAQGVSSDPLEKTLLPQPGIDERVELLGIVFRLAGSPEYQCDTFKEYDDAINRHFASFKWHSVILSAQLLRSTNGVAHDAVMSYAVHISIENGRIVLPDENSEKTLDKLDSRWNRKTPQLFVKQLDDFYVKSRFHEFFESHREMYQKTEEKIKAINDKIDYSWFKKFYGDANLDYFHIVPNCIDEQGGYGACCRFKDGHEEYFSMISAPGPDAPYHDYYIWLIIHEFNHSFCNPLVEKHLDDLMPAAERIFPFVANTMANQYYSRPDIMLNEYLVRACEIRYLLAHEMKDETDRLIQAYRNSRGFLWIEELVELLDRYEKERDKYPTLDDFMPEIVKMQNAIVTDEYIANLRKQEDDRPQVMATNPPNGAKDVDPNITEISITFDRPMMPGMAWCTGDGNKTFPERSEDAKWPVWSEDKQTCTMQNVVLKPGKTYNIMLNSDAELYSNIPGDGFRSTGNIPLKPVHYTFTTKAETE